LAKTRGDVEADLQNLLGALQQTRDQLEEFRTQAELLRISVEEHRTAIDTLEAYKDVKEGHEVLVPVGANAYVFANSSTPKSAITEIGAGLSAAMPIDVAVEKLRKRIERIEASRKKVLEGGSKLEANMAAIEGQVQSLYAQLQGAPAPAQGGQAHPGKARAERSHKAAEHED
jgi:prefoldin alpha subunit